ncbi:MAG: hypothetical protein QG608_715, partial [Actinomycetota bacterium]|nr:hypothetical protein [Actinomycetota bacterium]
MKGHTFKRCPCGPVHDDRGHRVNCSKKHGTWVYVHELPPDEACRRRQAKKGGFPTEKAARAAMNASIARVSAGNWVEYPKITVAEYLDEWFAGKTLLRPSTRRSYGEHLVLYLKPGLGYLKLQELRDVHVEALYAAMRELGMPEESGEPLSELARRLIKARVNQKAVPRLSSARIRRVHATLMSALNSGVKRKKLPDNPARYVEVPSGRRPRAVVWTAERVEHWRATGEHPPVAVWTAVQAGMFLDAAMSDRLYPIFHLIAYRGLRRGEAVGLRWIDVDLAGGRVTVTQQLVQIGWAVVVGEPKTETGERCVALDTATVAVLRAWQRRQATEKERCGDAWQDHGLVFTREDGSPLQPDTVSDAFHRVFEVAGLPPIRLHDLRHTAASLALQAGVPMKVVSQELGHSSLSITADTYSSVLPEVAAAAAEAVAGIIPRGASGVTDVVEPGQEKERNDPETIPLPIRCHKAPKRGATRQGGDLCEGESAGQTGAPGRDRTCDRRIRSGVISSSERRLSPAEKRLAPHLGSGFLGYFRARHFLPARRHRFSRASEIRSHDVNRRMPRVQDPLRIGEGRLVQGDGTRQVPRRLVGAGEVVPRGEGGWVVGPQHPLPIGQGCLVQGDGTRQVPRRLV